MRPDSPESPTTTDSTAWCDVFQAAAHAGVDPETLRRAARRGLIAAGHAGSRLRFRIADVDRWLRESGR